MGDVTIKSLLREDLQRFKMARDGATLAGVRSQLETQHRGMLPPNFVIKYEWGVASLYPRLSLSSPLALARSLSLSRALSRSRSRSRLLSLFRELRPITVVHSMMKPVVPDRSSTITVKIVTNLRIPSLRSSKSANPVCHED